MRRQRTTDSNILSSIDKTFDRIIFFVNPISTHIGQSMKRVSQIQKLYPEMTVDTVITSSKGREANAKLLYEHSSKLGPRTLLCIAAGDGTVSQVIETLIQSDKISANARLTSFLPLWGGNANDLAHMLNGRSRIPSRILLSRAKKVPIYPLKFCLTYKDGRKLNRIAACYASFGASAEVAQLVNGFGHRHSTLNKIPGGRLLREFRTAWTAVLNSPSFEVEVKGKPTSVIECTIVNGSRFGKAYRIPLRLDDRMFYLDVVAGPNSLVKTFTLIVSFFRRNMSDKMLRGYASLTIKKETWLQFDGEAMKVPAGIKVEVSISSRPFYALSTRLSDKSAIK